MLNLIDVHTHLNDPKILCQFDGVRERYLKENLKFVVDSGCSVQTSILCKNNADKYSEVYFTAGVHPDEANSRFNYADMPTLVELLNHKKCIAMGEIGLDYYYDGYNRDKQMKLFLELIDVANSLNMPIVIHSRSACKDTVDILKANKSLLKNGFLMHCYSESYETAKELLKLGAYFSFGGSLTFKNSKRGEVLKNLPIDRVLFETDAPYLTPMPFRGQCNESSYVLYVYKFVSELINMPLYELSAKIEDNFKTLFKKVSAKLN